MRKIFFVALALAPFSCAADYYAQDYDPNYLPYNFEEAKDADFTACDNVLAAYDDTYGELESMMRSAQMIVDSTNRRAFVTHPDYLVFEGVSIYSFTNLKERAEESIRQCIVELRDYEEEQEEKEKEREQREREAKRERRIQKALTECDFDFFDSMSTEDRMATYDERKACEEQSQSEPGTEIPQSVIIKSDPIVVLAATPSTVPIPISAPDSVGTESKPQAAGAAEPKEEESMLKAALATTTATSDKTLTLTEEELEQMVQQKVAEELQQQEEMPPQEQPSFFRKIINFFFGWL